MPTYRCFLRDPDGMIMEPGLVRDCPDDDAAVAWSLTLFEKAPKVAAVDLWQCGRKVRLTPRPA